MTPAPTPRPRRTGHPVIATDTAPLPELLTAWFGTRDRLYDLRTKLDQTDAEADEVQQCLTELVDIGDDIIGVLVPDVDERHRITTAHQGQPDPTEPPVEQRLSRTGIAVTLDAAGPPADLPDELKLHALRLDAPWNGFVVPVTTAAEFRRYVTAWQHHAQAHPSPTEDLFDPDDTVIEGKFGLTYRSNDPARDDAWPSTGVDDGTPIYALAGWQWQVCP